MAMTREELDFITLEQKFLQPLEEQPTYSELAKHILSWAIALDGMITLAKVKGSIHPAISVSNTEFCMLHQLNGIAEFGAIHINKKATRKWKEAKKWDVEKTRECLLILEQIYSHIPSERKRKIAELVIEFCQSRIHKHDNSLDLSYDERELETYREVKRLNRRGRQIDFHSLLH